jgi:hypothetical protein
MSFLDRQDGAGASLGRALERRARLAAAARAGAGRCLRCRPAATERTVLTASFAIRAWIAPAPGYGVLTRSTDAGTLARV